MAEAIAASLLKLIPGLVKLSKEEGDLGSQAKTELWHLEVLIKTIKSLLKEANSKEVIDEDLKERMKQMQEFLYDSADAIDDFMERGNRKWEGLGSKIWDHINRRTFASEAKGIKQKLENYTATLKTIQKFSADLAKSSSACHQSVSIAFSDEKDNDLVGIATARDQLSQLLTEDSPTRKVIFVHGTQGVGKTSLVRAVLREETVRRQFEYYVWVKDLRSCELADDKAAALLKTNAEMRHKREEPTQHELKEVFRCLGHKNVRWVLVLDDARSTHVFESLQNFLAQTCPTVLVTTRDSSLESTSRRFLNSQTAQTGDAPSEPAKLLYDIWLFKYVFHVFESLWNRLVQSCRTLLATTRDSSLACNSRTFLDSQMAQSDGAPVKPAKLLYDIRDFKHLSLSLKDSRTLLCWKTFQMDGHPDVLKDVVDSIVERCEGLPLAILAASDLLSDIQGNVSGTPRSLELKNLSGRLGEEMLKKRDKTGPIGRMTTLRMDHLPDVRDCLFYLSFFPLDRPVSCSTLMRLWMAEGFIEQKGTRPVQEIAEETLKKLVDHNLFREVEETSYGRAKTCRIHNILHQIIISKSKNDEFAMIVVKPQEAWPQRVWRLSFHCKMDRMEDYTKVKRLRSLFVFESLYPDCMEELLKQVSRLNVLDIQDSSLKKFPKEILALKYLRYLSLKGTSVTKIPDDIERLQHLETLNLKGTNVIELPESILQLKLLRHLLVYRSNGSPASSNHTKIGVKAPARLGELTSLNKLCLIDLDEVKRSIKRIIKPLKLSNSNHGNRLLEELGKLENLRRLGISNLKSEHVEHLHSLIKKLKNLESLHLMASAGDEGILDLEVDEIQVSPCLQRVHLTGYMVSLPRWILSPSLVKLVLKGSKLQENDPLQHFKGLPSLKHLDLQQAFCGVREMVFEERGFQQLRFLGLDTFDSLKSITVAEGALPALEKLSLARCEKLTEVPQGITYPKQLKCLELHQMPEAFVTAVEGDDAVRAIALEKRWIDGDVVGGDPTVRPMDRPESSRRPIANRK